MIEYATRADFAEFASKYRNLTEQINARKTAAQRSPSGSTFLSHSSKDDELVVGAIKILEGHGGQVYVDEKDPSLPPYTTKDTAAKLKERIQVCRKFVLLASENSKNSKWVPWELGLADGYKSISRIALFPAVERHHETQWTSWEYLGLYNRIVWGDLKGYNKKVWMVLNEDKNTATELSKWLKG